MNNGAPLAQELWTVGRGGFQTRGEGDPVGNASREHSQKGTGTLGSGQWKGFAAPTDIMLEAKRL